MTLQKLEFVILGRFQRPISPKFWGVRKNRPPMTHSRHPAFRWYRFGLCVMKTVGGVTRTKMRKRAIRTDRRTDRQTENNIPFSRGITTRCRWRQQSKARRYRHLTAQTSPRKGKGILNYGDFLLYTSLFFTYLLPLSP